MEFSNSKQKQKQKVDQSLCQFSEVDEDLRRIAEREANKQFCPFGERCYRKNAKHLQEFIHKSNDEIRYKDTNKNVEQKAKITDFFNRTPNIIKKISLEKPKDESDYEIEDDSDDDNNVMNVSNNQMSDSFETPSKRIRYSPFNKNSLSKTRTNNKRTNSKTKSKTNNRNKDNESDEELDPEIKALLNDSNESQVKTKNTVKTPKGPKNLNKNKNRFQKTSPYLKKLEFTPIADTLPKIAITNESLNVSHENQVKEEDEASTSRGLKPKMSPNELNELIKEIFLFEMPKDFFYFWQFCKNLKPEKPEDAFMEELGLRLVGAYDILTGKVKKSLIKDKEDILCHWRYYYDLPEFQTIVAHNKSGYHLGYFRDTPDEENPVIVANNSDKSCVIEGIGDNIFAAIYFEIQKHKSKDKTENKQFIQMETKLKEFCARNKIIFNANTKLRSRKSKVIASTFNNFGFIVPIDKSEVGYRPLPESDSNLKKLLTRICKVDVEVRNDSSSLGELKEMIQLVNYANDECDFGMGLELGIDLFCFGDDFFHKSILFLMPMAYHLLNRETFGRIIKAHINNRRKGHRLDSISVNLV